MSLPWPDAGFVVTRISDLTERAVTVKQLRQLSLFLQRLCKALLLKHSSQHSKENGCYDEYITWFDINMYDITSEVIKKVIPYVNPKIQGARHAQMAQEWCSWSEFVAHKPQPARLMISHWWGGRFRDFMRVIQELCVDEALPGSTPLWVCTFANNQWGEDFGDRLATCPFYQTVAAADLTVLIVDRSAGSLGRVWCGLELYLTIQSQKRLLIYTPSGLVGHSSGRASSGPLIEAIKAWDIRQTNASEDAYRRQILNYIAGIDEFQGLQVAADGRLLRDHGRPLLKDQDHDTRSREGEYTHEASLFKDHSKVFEELNMMVRVEVYATVGRSHLLHGCHVPRKEHRGVLLGQWRAFTRQAEAAWCERRWCSDAETPPPASFQDADVHVIYNFFIKPRIGASRRSYMEIISAGPQLPKYYISLSLSTRISDAAAAIDWWAEALHLPDSAVLFVDFLSSRPEGSQEAGEHRDIEASAEHIKGVAFPAADELLECQAMLGVLDHDAPEMASAWRFLEFEFASRNGLDIYLACATGALACSCPFADGSWVFGRFDADIGRSMQYVSSRNCRAEARELQAIKDYFESRGHGQAIYDQIDRRFQRWGAGPVLREAAECDDDEEVKAICMNPSLVINGSSLQGAHSETALHIAAAAGSMEAMRALLRLHADPNAQDQLGETPLHYAALAGQSAAASLLLEAKANILCENSLAQDPLFVAQQHTIARVLNPGGEDATVFALAQLLQWNGGSRPASAVGYIYREEGGSLYRWVVQSHGGVQNFVNAHADARLSLFAGRREAKHAHKEIQFPAARSVAVNIKTAEGVKVVQKLASTVDVFLEPFRPGVVEKLGLGPEVLCSENPGLIYGRMTGYGQGGTEFSSMAGHDNNYLALAGTLDFFRRGDEKPFPPANFAGDYAGGAMMLALGVLLALVERSRSGRGQVIDAAMVDGANYTALPLFKWMQSGLVPVGSDGHVVASDFILCQAPHWSDIYLCKEDPEKKGTHQYISVQAIEPQFYKVLLNGLELAAEELPAQYDRKAWPLMKSRFASIFLTKTRDEWDASSGESSWAEIKLHP
ncbi:Amacr [Symbiodinium sp. CCMP2456]|nr:Amacr [Symbiodinium sp. CCMP2456]